MPQQEKVYTIAEYHALRGRMDQAAPATPRAQPPTPESRTDIALLRKIQALAKRHGWHGQHTTRGETDTADLECLLVREVLLYALLLTDTAKLTAKQLEWMDALRATGSIEVAIWRPCNVSDITARLARKRGT